MRPLPDIEQAARMRQSAFDTQNGKGTSSLPVFSDRYGNVDENGESIPLTALQHQTAKDDDWDDYNDNKGPYDQPQAQYPGGFVAAQRQPSEGPGSVVEGVGGGYGRRYDHNPTSPTSPGGGIPSSLSAGQYGAGVAGLGVGAGSQLAADARARRGLPDTGFRDVSQTSTVEPFTGMHDNAGQYYDPYSAPSHDPYTAPSSPPPPAPSTYGGPAPSYMTHQPPVSYQPQPMYNTYDPHQPSFGGQQYR